MVFSLSVFVPRWQVVVVCVHEPVHSMGLPLFYTCGGGGWAVLGRCEVAVTLQAHACPAHSI